MEKCNCFTKTEFKAICSVKKATQALNFYTNAVPDVR